jgi:hypothetical protein
MDHFGAAAEQRRAYEARFVELRDTGFGKTMHTWEQAARQL